MKFTVGHDHPALPGHFPGAPIVPGVVLLEQVLVAIEARHGEPGGLRLPVVKFLQPLFPGEEAEVDLTELEHTGAGPGESALHGRRWRFRVRRGGTVLASGEVVAS